MASALRWILLLHLGFCVAWMDERPVLESRDGHLTISSAKDRNITLKMIGEGYLNVNEINLLHIASAAQNATRVIDRWRMGYLTQMQNSLHQLTTIVTGSTGLQRRVALLERAIDGNGTIRTDDRSRTPSNSLSNMNKFQSIRVNIRRINVRLAALEVAIRTLNQKLRENECQSDPCQNGGTCTDLYDSYQCHCTSNWEGPNCMTDINECARFVGTDLGCQNGATCRNLLGSYQCDCLPGWFGLHCTQKTSICNTENSEALCGEHGVCVAKSNSLGYTCICDQGWESDGANPACIKDVDECASNHPPCSINPPVPCRNTRGSFTCGSCPHGYSGNGYYCSDIDECLINNGGCSTSPYVQCVNTMGSRVCGTCPLGYRGDGVSCIFVGGCAINNGGCHPLAICTENPSLTSSYVLCRCPAGYVGSGMGPNGCQLADVSVNTVCTTNPCVHGTCVPNGANGFTCTCNPGYTGTTCNVPIDPCTPNPCRNNGICVVSKIQATCQCTSSFTGRWCEISQQTCGGVLRNPTGTVQFPIGGSTYQHGLSCAWVLITEPSKVLNITFTSFSLEHSTDCKFDFLQIHDGRNAGSQMINRFCGQTLPNENGNIVSSHNALYLWFHSDDSVSSDGFTFLWSTIDPVCGGVLENNYGTIASPGSPGRYPPNRDCVWQINVADSKRIQFYFGLMMLEENCENDYVEITGMTDDERLGLYCNHTHPPPLITPDSQATVHFHSNGDVQDVGFQIHYSMIEGTPGCGGTYTSPSGMINSPGHSSSNYQPNMHCEWKIQLPKSGRIRASWLRFDLETSTNCQFDYIEIYDGPSTLSQLLGRYCGSDLPPTIKSTSNTLVIIFKSDWSYEAEGFTLSYETLCGGEFREETGIIMSPLYPDSYHRSRTCIYEIIQPINKGIILTMEDLDIEGTGLECHYDYVEIYDGDNENATRLAKLCGYRNPDVPYYSTHNYMYIKFTTDNSIEGRGFKANYTTINRKCGGLLKEATGVIHPPTENKFDSDIVECIWTIQAPPGYVIQLSWITFNITNRISCTHDYVSIYENYTSPNENVTANTYCGRNKPPETTTQDRILTILFHTESHTRISLTQAFIATYIFVDVTKVCGGRYSKPNGVIRSPNFPNNYPNNKDCVWIIQAPNRHRITLTIHSFALENSLCAFDYLEIRNGAYDSAPLIGKFCGTEIPAEIPSHTNQLYIKFVSDFSRSMQGFDIEWDSTTQGCGGTMDTITGAITSPNYPESYSINADCIWKIAVAAGSLVQLIIVDLDLESQRKCQFDFIEIFDGISHRTNGRRYCTNNYPHIIQSKSNQMTIRFRSDYSIGARGFYLKYETQCHNKLHGYYGVLESPNFPNKYEHSLNCNWTIEAPMGNTINLTFSHFDLEIGSMDEDQSKCQFDYVQIMEGEEDTFNTELGRYCGTVDLPLKIHSSQRQVLIVFSTDSFIAFNGFRLEWRVHGCGGYLTKPYDEFTSPGYPSSYPTNVECEWLIEVDYTFSIELTLHEINTEKHKTCVFDKLEIYSGENTDAPKLAQVCYSDKPLIYTSSGNKMFVKFYSDSTYANRGFNASYRTVPTECGGKFITNSGTIHSPKYPLNYPHGQNCEWLIEVDRNHIVNLTFLDFDVENSRHCKDDFVKIFDGTTRDDPLLATLCSNQLPPSYVSSSNQMLVVMQSDSIVTAKGFSALYKRACGARIIVKDNGFITSPTVTNNVNDGTEINCTWTLIAENPGDHVTITFTHMEIDPTEYSLMVHTEDPCTWDYVQVFEGEGIDGPSLGTWCNNKTPPPITSTGSSLTLHLFVRYEFLGYFAATYSSLNTACGGNYTSEHGTITSPQYPNSYPLNAECVWILNTSPGNKLTLAFTEFDVESSENCDLDYLEIRENSGMGKLISVSCGKDATAITTSSNLWIKFKSDNSGTAKGFTAEYSFLAGNELEGPVGRITSPLYPLPCRRTAASFSWRVTVDMDSAIRIEFKTLRIENLRTSCYASIKIFDGYDNEAPKLLEACGFTLPDPVESSSNVVYITMMTGFLRSGNLFDLTWLQIPRDTQSTNKEVKLSECNKEIALMDERNLTYAFSSPGWPTGYAPDLHCNWVFTSPPGTHLVLRIMSMNLEETSDCIADAVSVYSGYALTSTSNAKLESKLCLANSTIDLVKTTNVMTVKFDTDSFVNKTGFNAYVYRDCGGQLTDPNGVIEYDISTLKAIRTWHFTCEWNVTVKAGRTIKIQIVQMSIHEMPDNSCSNDYLLLKDGHEMLSPVLGNGKYCGNVTPPELKTTGNRFYIKATGNNLNFSFKLTYREVSMNCGDEFILTSKQNKWLISTPNYPNMPPAFAECTWIATAPAGEKLSIHFLDRFDLSNSENCEKEYVEIRDGGTDGSKLLGRYCTDIAPSSINTIGNMIYIYYYTELSEPKNGFQASIVSGEACGGILRGTSGVIVSPNYPHFYPINQNCSWLIVGPTDHTLKLQFRDLQLPGFRECLSSDYVKIEEKFTENDTMLEIGTYCGLRKPDVIETSSNKAYVYFKSDNRQYVNYKGFSLNFTASQETCGGSLTAMSGIIKSPGYPNPRTRPRYCDWRIKVPVGYQIVVDILDIDVVNEPGSTHVGYALSFYNDFRYKSKIKVLGQGASTEQIRSSTNTMSLGYWSSIGHRGFKLRYTATAPAPCGANLRELEGNITGPTTLPFNQTSYVCHWRLEPPENMISPSNDTSLTLTVKVNGNFEGNERGNIIRRNCLLPQYVELQGIGMLCGNTTEPRYLRSPKLVNDLTVVNGTYGKHINFNIYYKWQPCGGILRGPSHTVTAPKNISNPINCVWHVNYPENEIIKLSFPKLLLHNNCDLNYIIVRNDGPTAPQIIKYCDFITTKLPSNRNITSSSNQLWIEYHTSVDVSDFTFNVEVARTGCGGSLRGRSREILSPGFPKQYPNNTECTWEIFVENGYHIGLVFVDRFSLETSPDCKNDYVEIFDWIRIDNVLGEWKSLRKICGRDTFPPFNSTSNRMKVIFHSNEAVQLDGFRAVWNENCGGIFQATDNDNVIQSPSYPNFYPPSVFCNYTIVAPNEDIIIEFTDFQLELGRGYCPYDNVTIITENKFYHDRSKNEEIFCGNNKPPLLRSTSKIEVIFITDKYVQRSGYQFKYFLSKCGGIITRPSELKPLMHGNEYFGRMNCTWLIKAPQGKSVLIRFETFVLEYSTNCYFDSVAVYEGDSVRLDKRIGLVCGNLTAPEHLPTFKSESNSMVVNFKTDNTWNFEGFTAKVLFTTSPNDGCGESINMTSIRSKSFRTQQAATYQSFEECHWTVVTSPGKNIKFTINNMDIKNSTNNNTRSDICTGDFLEVRDGSGPYAELLGQYCGNTVPLPIVSTSNLLWIRFYTDGTAVGSGATATLDVVDLLCGLTTRILNESTQILTSPGYPHTSDAQCRWTLYHSNAYSDRLRIRFIDFEMADSNKCETEYLEISEHQTFINEGFGADFIYSGTKKHPISIHVGSRLPFSSYKYCGNQLPHDYYSASNNVQITYKSISNHNKGFKLEFGPANCDRNYTSEQGRIFHQGFLHCWVTITAPANHTISLYFNEFSIFDREHCTHNALQVHDGDSSGPLLATLCSIMIPNPIFSTGNKLTLHSWTEGADAYQSYDIIYTTTDAGRGCGGRIFNYGGKFTSPLYPNIYRNNTVCTWDVSVPRGFKIILEFLDFDIGTKKSCGNNNVQVYDVLPNEELLRSTYCGGDDPARIESDSDRILVKYTSTMNNIGTGWVIAFMAQSAAYPIDLYDHK